MAGYLADDEGRELMSLNGTRWGRPGLQGGKDLGRVQLRQAKDPSTTSPHLFYD